MGFWDTLTDLVEAATPWATAEAEAPAAETTVCICVVVFIVVAMHLMAGLGCKGSIEVRCVNDIDANSLH